MKNLIIGLLVTAFGIQVGSSQTFFEKISTIKWKGEGQLLGSSASFVMEWTPVLDGKFYQLTFQNNREESQGYVFNAIAMYHIKEDNEVTGTWFDSRGFTFPIKGEVSEDKLIIFWGSPELEEGKTIYTMKTDSTIIVEDFILRDDGLKKFGNAKYVPKE